MLFGWKGEWKNSDASMKIYVTLLGIKVGECVLGDGKCVRSKGRGS